MTKHPAHNSKHYNPAKDMLAPAARPGADDGLQIPSRVNDRLYFRDGRCTDLAGKPIKPMTPSTQEHRL